MHKYFRSWRVLFFGSQPVKGISEQREKVCGCNTGKTWSKIRFPTSSETQGHSVGSGEKAGRKFSTTWKLSSRLFSRPDWLPLGLRGWVSNGLGFFFHLKVHVFFFCFTQSLLLKVTSAAIIIITNRNILVETKHNRNYNNIIWPAPFMLAANILLLVLNQFYQV